MHGNISVESTIVLIQRCSTSQLYVRSTISGQPDILSFGARHISFTPLPPSLPQRAEEARLAQQQRVEDKLSAALQGCRNAEEASEKARAAARLAGKERDKLATSTLTLEVRRCDIVASPRNLL